MNTGPKTPGETSNNDAELVISDDLLQRVTAAIINLAGQSEVDLAELASEGRLHEVFPFKLPEPVASTLEKWDAVVEAPARPLTDEEYLKFLLGRI